MSATKTRLQSSNNGWETAERTTDDGIVKVRVNTATGQEYTIKPATREELEAEVERLRIRNSDRRRANRGLNQAYLKADRERRVYREKHSIVSEANVALRAHLEHLKELLGRKNERITRLTKAPEKTAK